MYKNDEWHKMKVGWTKSDIISGVLRLAQRNVNPSIMDSLSCYLYKDSKLIAKSSTYTRVIPKVDLDKEKELIEETRRKFEEKQKQIEQIKSTLKLYKYDNLYMYDILPYYQSLRLKEIEDGELMNKEIFDTEEHYNNYINSNKYKQCCTYYFFNSIRENKYDMISTQEEYIITNSTTELKNYDAFYNIKIYNATYAKLVSSYNIELDADIIDNTNKVFGFNDLNKKQMVIE